jgi:hypothetical protein
VTVRGRFGCGNCYTVCLDNAVIKLKLLVGWVQAWMLLPVLAAGRVGRQSPTSRRRADHPHKGRRCRGRTCPRCSACGPSGSGSARAPTAKSPSSMRKRLTLSARETAISQCSRSRSSARSPLPGQPGSLDSRRGRGLRRHGVAGNRRRQRIQARLARALRCGIAAQAWPVHDGVVSSCHRTRRSCLGQTPEIRPVLPPESVSELARRRDRGGYRGPAAITRPWARARPRRSRRQADGART